MSSLSTQEPSTVSSSALALEPPNAKEWRLYPAGKRTNKKADASSWTLARAAREAAVVAQEFAALAQAEVAVNHPLMVTGSTLPFDWSILEELHRRSSRRYSSF